MLPDKIKGILMEYEKFNNFGPDREWCIFKAPLDQYERHSTFLDACGHDTHELVGAIARMRAAVQELKQVNESMNEQFKKDPFPFAKVAASEVKPDECAD
jgi:hypothetical protein